MNPLLLVLLAAPYPDAIDVLRTAGVKPRMNLLLDSSCSMGWDPRPTNCTWFANRYLRGNKTFTRNGQMRAVLVGCVQEGDGILDKWADQVDFALHDFGGVRAGFGSDLTTLKTAAASVPNRGGTPLSQVQDRGGEYMNTQSTDADTDSCTPFFHLLLSDGDPNGGWAQLSQDCTSPVESLRVGSREPWRAAEYLNKRHPDVLCNMAGDQTITTYTLGFGKIGAGGFNPMFLQRTADEGGGRYFYASSVPELINAFDSIMATVVARSTPLSELSVGQDAFFSENRGYASAFKPSRVGLWHGNLRRVCLFPPRTSLGDYDTSVDTCLFRTPDGENLLSNPGVKDLWTGLGFDGVRSGGAGEVLAARLGATPSAPYWSKRRIVTWRPGTPGWVSVDPSAWTSADAHVSGCDHFKLVNALHGYTRDADCTTGAPLARRDWVLSDPINAAPVELRFGACEAPDGTMVPGRCYVALATNDGMLHFFDSANGEETSAIIPAELWGTNVIARSAVSTIFDQPSRQFTHRFLLDGTMQVEHDDSDGDGVIDSHEKAYLLFSLGRGGRASYVLDVSRMSDGIVDDQVSVRPILPRSGTILGRMADTWSAPTTGVMQIGDEVRSVGVYTTGHEPQFDFSVRTTAGRTTYLEFLDDQVTGQVRSVSCTGTDGFAEANGYGTSGLCAEHYHSNCAGTAQDPCYDGSGFPMDHATRTLTYSDGVNLPAALRFHFSSFDLGPGDVLRVETDQGTLVAEYRNQDLQGAWTDWVYAVGATLRLVTDGVDSAHEGYVLDLIEWEAGLPSGLYEPSSMPEPRLGVDHRPALVVVDYDALAATTAFSGETSLAPVVMVVANSCVGAPGVCVDTRTSSDLQYMVCPISGPVAPFTRDGRLVTLYFGDECGQLFKVGTADDGQTWTAKRLLNLNSGVVGLSKDHRKIFRRLDVVESICPGQEVVGLYFGTGNVQRPLATDELQQSSLTNGRDLIGVLWDHEDLPGGVTQDDLQDGTSVGAIDPQAAFASGKHGWSLSLNPQERMLQDPLVLDGVAFFKTFEPSGAASACDAGAGLERTYAVNNCTAEAIDVAIRPGADPRVVASVGADRVSPLVLLAPKDAAPMVVNMDLSGSHEAVLGRKAKTRPGLYLWRDLP